MLSEKDEAESILVVVLSIETLIEHSDSSLDLLALLTGVSYLYIIEGVG